VNPLVQLAERGALPDAVVAAGIRKWLRQRLEQEGTGDVERDAQRLQRHADVLRRGPLAVETDKANEQHYELPAEFFTRVLGRRMKYSSGYWPDTVRTLDDAEETMLRLTAERAGIQDGQDVLELGCGWGSLTLWLAEQYPACRITGVSNSSSQREFILAAAARRGLANVEIITADMNRFDAARRFDRIVSVEMFEHMRNYELLLARVARWLKPDGRLFVHIFVHRAYAYLFETGEAADWMARYFFTGGQMPSDHLLLYFQRDLLLERHWRVNGVHYEKTLRAWLARMDGARAELRPALEQVYGAAECERWWVRWRLFLLACAELFGYAGGNEWFVSHYLFRPRAETPA